MKKKFKKALNNFSMPNDSTAEITIYGTISDNLADGEDSITPEQIAYDLEWINPEKIKTLIIRINSAGGDVFAATAIYSRLKELSLQKIVKIEGWAASAATIIAMAGDEIEIAPNGSLMIHDPLFNLEGYFSAKELEKYVEQLAVIKKSIINAYQMKTGKTEEELTALMEKETWYTGTEAVEAGFCDRLMFEEADIIAFADGKIKINGMLVKEKFQTLPQTVLNQSQQETYDKDFSIQTPTRKEVKDMGEPKAEIKTVDDLKKLYPKLVNEIEEKAKKEELVRLEAIDKIATQGTEDIINEAKYNTKLTAGEVALKILNAQKEQGKNFLRAREQDVQNSNMHAVEKSTSETQGTNEFLEAINKVFTKTK